MNISDDTRIKIRTKIAEIENQTRSELVCMITKRSARYVYFPLLLSCAASLFLPALPALLKSWDYSFEVKFLDQAAVFLVLASLFLLSPVGRLLTPKWLKIQNCTRYCLEQFFAHRLHETAERSAILFFVSWEEKFVNVVADKGIHEKIDEKIWKDIVEEFISKVKERQIEVGFLSSLEKFGALLIKHFPADSINKNEISNHLIEFDGPDYLS